MKGSSRFQKKGLFQDLKMDLVAMAVSQPVGREGEEGD
jgi:hypothetical protein